MNQGTTNLTTAWNEQLTFVNFH